MLNHPITILRTQASLGINEAFTGSLVHSASPEGILKPAKQTGKAWQTRILSFCPPSFRLKTSKSTVNLSSTLSSPCSSRKVDNIIGESLNLHLGFLFILYACLPFSPCFATKKKKKSSLPGNFQRNRPYYPYPLLNKFSDRHWYDSINNVFLVQ